jgi:hypothetical protein
MIKEVIGTPVQTGEQVDTFRSVYSPSVDHGDGRFTGMSRKDGSRPSPGPFFRANARDGILEGAAYPPGATKLPLPLLLLLLPLAVSLMVTSIGGYVIRVDSIIWRDEHRDRSA